MTRRRAAVSHCVGCGCNDFRACIDGCWWLEVDTERGIGVCSQCGLKHSVRVFSVGEGTWWAGTGNAAEILAVYRKDTGNMPAEAAGSQGELPRELTLLELHRMSFNGGERGFSDKRKTFFQTLNEMVQSGAMFPCAFSAEFAGAES